MAPKWKETYLRHHWEIMSSNPKDATAICQETKRAKLAMLFGWQGWHTLSPVLIRVTPTSHGLL